MANATKETHLGQYKRESYVSWTVRVASLGDSGVSTEIRSRPQAGLWEPWVHVPAPRPALPSTAVLVWEPPGSWGTSFLCVPCAYVELCVD